MKYSPLTGDHEIRLLTILPEQVSQGAGDDTLSCLLEHVSISRDSICEASKRGEPCKGFDGIWSGRQPDDHSNLWNVEGKAKYSSNLEQNGNEVQATTIGSNTSYDASDDQRPWRYTWGDYVALSYVWGDLSITSEIIVNGESMSVTTNLAGALTTLRLSPRIKQGFKIWIDAICINQADIAERSRQVSRMQEIYASAWHVVVWLGAEANESNLALNALTWLGNRASDANFLDEFYRVTKPIDLRPFFIKWSNFVSPVRKEVYTALYHLLSRPYWRRLWILQELAAGSDNTPVLCGTRSVTWREIRLAATFIQNDEHRFGRDILDATGQRSFGRFEWDLTNDRLPHTDDVRSYSEKLWKLLLMIAELQRIQENPSSQHLPGHELWTEPLSAFLLSRGALVSDERDRVYGIMGLRGISHLLASNFISDYRLSSLEVFRAFSQVVILRGHLDLLRLVHSSLGEVKGKFRIVRKIAPTIVRRRLPDTQGGVITSPCPHSLPSWVVCWTCPRGPLADLRGTYSASDGLPQTPAPIFESTHQTMTVYGVLFDSISSLSSMHPEEADPRFPLNSTESIRSIYGSSSCTRTAFWNTIVAGTTESGSTAPESFSILLGPKLWTDDFAGAQTHGLGLHDFLHRNQRLHISGQTTLKKFLTSPSEEKVLGSSTSQWHNKRIYNPSTVELNAAARAMNVLAWRRLVVTSRGYLGLAPGSTEPQDRVAVLLGCSMPLVLRPVLNGWIVIGECYVYGLMNGELAEMVQEGKVALESIMLR